MKKMSITQTEIVGCAKNEIELLTKERTALEPLGIDVDKFVGILTEKLDKAVAANARQEARKRALKDDTADVEATHDDLYRTTSGYLDAIMGVVGKGSTAAKNFQRLRSRIRMPGDQTANDAATPVEPLPEAQQ
jgi:hypothetical protein